MIICSVENVLLGWQSHPNSAASSPYVSGRDQINREVQSLTSRAEPPRPPPGHTSTTRG